jgi:hypothetical protein
MISLIVDQNRAGSLFFLAVQQLMGPVSGSLSVFGQEKAVFLREYSNNYYVLSAYFFSKLLVEVCQCGGCFLLKGVLLTFFIFHLAAVPNCYAVASDDYNLLECRLPKHPQQILYSSGILHRVDKLWRK